MKIFWTSEEHQAVLYRYGQLIKDNAGEDISPTVLMLEAQNEAVSHSQLKPYRLRPLRNFAAVKLVKMYQKDPEKYSHGPAQQDLPFEAQKPVQKPPAPEPAMVEQPKPVEQPTPKEEITYAEPPEDPMEVFMDSLIYRGAELVAGVLNHPMVHKALGGLVSTALGKQAPGVVDAASPWPPEQIRVKHPKVLVAGLKGDQLTETQKLFGDKLDIRFWNKDESYHQLKVLAKNCSYAVGMAGWLSHSHTAIMKANAPQSDLISGGVSMLGKLLRQRYEL